MSKLALKVTRGLLKVAYAVQDFAEGVRLSALGRELGNIVARREERDVAEMNDRALESGLLYEIDFLVGEDDA